MKTIIYVSFKLCGLTGLAVALPDLSISQYAIGVGLGVLTALVVCNIRRRVVEEGRIWLNQ